MTIRPISKNGTLVSVEAFAGTVNGRKMRKRFPIALYGDEEKARKAADTWAKNKIKQIRSQRAYGALMDERLLSQVSEAIELLSPHNVSLIEVVREWTKERQPKKPDEPEVWTFNEAQAALLKHRMDKGAQPQYIEDLEISLSAFGQEFGHYMLTNITTQLIEQWLDARGISPVTRSNWRRDLSMVWRFAMLRGHVATNPVSLLARAIRSEQEVTFLTPESARKLFSSLQKKQNVESKQAIQFTALACFAGLRTSEIFRLDPGSIDLTNKLIEVRARGRTRRRRFVQIPDNLSYWLEKFFVVKEPIVTITFRVLRNRLRQCLPVLQQNVMRHSWFSYHLALHQNPNLTQHEGGHLDSGLLYRHYRALVTKEAAEEWFSISPDNVS